MSCCSCCVSFGSIPFVRERKRKREIFFFFYNFFIQFFNFLFYFEGNALGSVFVLFFEEVGDCQPLDLWFDSDI